MAATPPPGVRALQINNKQMDTYQLKIGPGRKDTVPYKLFNKKEMLDEVIALGFYSAWSTVKKDIEAYPGSELLVVADVDEIYGENWWIALTEEAKEAYFYVSTPFFPRQTETTTLLSIKLKAPPAFLVLFLRLTYPCFYLRSPNTPHLCTSLALSAGGWSRCPRSRGGRCN